MKKIDKIDMFFFVCIIIGCVFGLATIISGWILGEQIVWFELLSAIFIGLPSCVRMCWFSSDILAKIIYNHRENKNKK